MGRCPPQPNCSGLGAAEDRACSCPPQEIRGVYTVALVDPHYGAAKRPWLIMPQQRRREQQPSSAPASGKTSRFLLSCCQPSACSSPAFQLCTDHVFLYGGSGRILRAQYLFSCATYSSPTRMLSTQRSVTHMLPMPCYPHSSAGLSKPHPKTNAPPQRQGH